MATIIGTDTNDRLDGGARADLIEGYAGDDTLSGHGGPDRLFGGPGQDWLDGGRGADELWGGGGGDLLGGGAGADRLAGGAGFDFAVYSYSRAGVVVDLALQRGFAGEATGDELLGVEGIVGSGHDDALRGDAADNILYGGFGADTIHGLDGNDLIDAEQHPRFSIGATLSEEFSQYFGGEGNDTIWGSAIPGGEGRLYQPSEIHGGNGDDEIYSGQRVYAGAGNDFVYGGTGDATIFGGAGNDEIQATYASHTVFAGPGKDLVWTEALHGGTQTIDLGGGDDWFAMYSYDAALAHVVEAGTGTDTFYYSYVDMISYTAPVSMDALAQLDGAWQSAGVLSFTGFERFVFLLAGEHDDQLALGALADTAAGGDGNDYLLGRGGADLLQGGYGSDTVLGGAGRDVVMAGSSRAGMPDVARGGSGDDVVYGNFSSADFSGVARLFGDAGADVFAFLPGGIYTPDIVMDFNPLQDRIAVYAGAYWLLDPATRSFDTIAATDVIDTADLLRFSFVGRFGPFDVREIDLRYDKGNGTVSVRDGSSGFSDWIRVCTVAGAPDLAPEHFLSIPETGVVAAGSGSAGAQYYGLDPASIPPVPELYAADGLPML